MYNTMLIANNTVLYCYTLKIKRVDLMLYVFFTIKKMSMPLGCIDKGKSGKNKTKSRNV